MNQDEFWDLLDTAKTRAPDDLEERAATLEELLGKLSLDEVLEFDRIFTEASHALFTTQILAAAEVMIGDTTDDVFADFRSWVIGQGRAVYEQVLNDPDTALADLKLNDEDEIGAGESISSAARNVYRTKTGFSIIDQFPDRPTADYPQFDIPGPDLGNRKARRAQFPKLAAKYRPHPIFQFPWRN